MELDVAKWFDEEFSTPSGGGGGTNFTAYGASPSAGIFAMLATGALTFIGVSASSATFALTGSAAVNAAGASPSSATMAMSSGFSMVGTSPSSATFALTGTATVAASGASPSRAYIALTGNGEMDVSGASSSAAYFNLTASSSGSFTAFGASPSSATFALTGTAAMGAYGGAASAAYFDPSGSLGALTFNGSSLSGARFDLQQQAAGVIFLTGVSSSSAIFALTGPSTGPQPAGKHRKRYGVQDGWKLLLFNTKVDADAYRQSLRKDIPAKKLKRIKTVEPAQTIDLPELKKSLPPLLVPKLDKMIRDREYGQIQDLHTFAKDQEAERLRASALKAQQEQADIELMTHVVRAHSQIHMQKVQEIHRALKLLHDIQRLRSIR
jgi:hypothetical protein